MKYPQAVQEKIDILNEYDIDENLKQFNIIHMYPKKLAYPNGYYDSRFFDLHIFNTDEMKKYIITNRDGLTFANDMDIRQARIFADGSTIMVFHSMHTLDIFSDCYIS